LNYEGYIENEIHTHAHETLTRAINMSVFLKIRLQPRNRAQKKNHIFFQYINIEVFEVVETETQSTDFLKPPFPFLFLHPHLVAASQPLHVL
jgi:hypothetical protein